jgi:lysophospholipase L1-like esterase
VYAALGDSFVAGPLIPVTEANSGCFRSDSNYPSLLAPLLGVQTLRDVSCSAAKTKDLSARQRTLVGTRVPPQLDAVDGDTDLVTVQIGGNDFGLFSGGASGDEPPPGLVPRIGQRVETALRRVRQRAPRAQVVLVGYPRLVDPGTSCPGRLPYGDDQLAIAYDVQSRLNEAMRRAADATGSAFVDLFAASEGHGICSRDPWVNGSHTVRGRAAAYHPLMEGMQAAAAAIAARLTR